MRKICFIFIVIINLTAYCQSSKAFNSDSMKTKQVNVGDRKISLTTLNKKETKELVNSLHGKENAGLSKKYTSKAYILNDGSLILSHEGGGALYKSVKDLDDLMTFLNKNAKSHPFVNGIPYGIDYLKNIDRIIDSFAEKINIERSKLDNSTQSLKLVEQKLKSLNLDEFELEKEYLAFLVTYSGEVIRNSVGGTWTLLNLNIDGHTVYEPVIRKELNRDYSPLWPILTEISERPSSFSFSTAIGAEIEKYKIMDFMLNKQK